MSRSSIFSACLLLLSFPLFDLSDAVPLQKRDAALTDSIKAPFFFVYRDGTKLYLGGHTPTQTDNLVTETSTVLVLPTPYSSSSLLASAVSTTSSSVSVRLSSSATATDASTGSITSTTVYPTRVPTKNVVLNSSRPAATSAYVPQSSPLPRSNLTSARPASHAGSVITWACDCTPTGSSPSDGPRPTAPAPQPSAQAQGWNLTLSGESGNPLRKRLILIKAGTPTVADSITRVTPPSQSSKSSVSCDVSSKFTIDFDDYPLVVTKGNHDPADFPPVSSPYHNLYFSPSFAYVPPPPDPFLPESPPYLAIFRGPGSNNTAKNKPSAPQGTYYTADASLSKADPSWGIIGGGPHARDSAYWFNAYRVAVGCDDRQRLGCTMNFRGYSIASRAAAEKLVVQQTVVVPPCTSFPICQLKSVIFSSSFRGLTSIRAQAVVAGKPKDFLIDDLQLAWSDSSCAAAGRRKKTA
ncbi:MAG: hypothetical protein M1825_006491 [Sarcosagium campestre]|nr:MAG: hypothetical protein M1825_006491 [Sarcosagium campestre]